MEWQAKADSMDSLMMFKLFGNNLDKVGSKLQLDVEEREEFAAREMTELDMAEFREWRAT